MFNMYMMNIVVYYTVLPYACILLYIQTSIKHVYLSTVCFRHDSPGHFVHHDSPRHVVNTHTPHNI